MVCRTYDNEYNATLSRLKVINVTVYEWLNGKALNEPTLFHDLSIGVRKIEYHPLLCIYFCCSLRYTWKKLKILMIKA